jgi:hypothetical protein
MTGELDIITRTYDLILWSLNHTSKFPRDHRFSLGARLEDTLYSLFDNLIEAKSLLCRAYVRYVDDSCSVRTILAI